MPTGSGDGRRKKNSVGRLGAKVDPVCALTAGASARGWPKRIGVESWWNDGNPIGRNSGKSSNTPVKKACNPNDVRVVHPRRERSAHDESTVLESMHLSNMVSSKMECCIAKDTRSPLRDASQEINDK